MELVWLPSEIRAIATLVLSKVGNLKVQRCGDLQQNDVHTKYHESVSTGSKVSVDTHAYKRT